MFIVVTVETQQLPIAAVPRIIVVVVVLVMDRELTKLFAIKFASAPGTDPRVNLECSLPIGLFALLPVAPSLGNNSVWPVGIFWDFIRWHNPLRSNLHF